MTKKYADLTGISETVEIHPQLNSTYNVTVNGGTRMSSLVAVSDITMHMVDVQMKDVCLTRLKYFKLLIQ